MIKFLVFWLIWGLVCMTAVAVGHITKAIKMGYDVETISEANSRLLNSVPGGMGSIFVKFIFGWLIWPYRMYEFLGYQIPYRFYLYDLIQKEKD